MTKPPHSAAEERSLCQRIVDSGDERAFRELYRRHTPALVQLVLRMLGGASHDAEDVVQEAWVRAVRQLAGFRWESSFKTWLSAIALNLAREVLRKRGRAAITELPDDLATPATTRRDGVRIDLERAIARLPDGYRTVLVLHDVEGYTHEEISRHLEIAVGTSKSQLFDARRALRAMLQPLPEARHA
jgi:RNA polymerase sigma-70 factor (ECF subfamily)